METITPFDWHRLFIGEHPPLYFLEIVFRIVCIYAFAVIVLRYMGKRGRRQMSPFELVLVIALGSATGDSMLYPEVPIFYAWLIIFVMVLLNLILGELQYHSKSINTFLEGAPRVLVKEGEVIEKNLHKEHLRRDELFGLLREREISNTGEVQYIFLEQTGHVGLFRREEAARTKGEDTLPQEID